MPNTLLKNIRVSFISLVRKGANKKQIIFKSSDDDAQQWNVPIKKYSDEKGMVYGIVYAPDEVDSQGEFTTKEEIEQSAYDFMKSLNMLNVDKQHNFKPEEGAFVAESWLIRKGDSLFPKEKEGSWAVGIKLEDEDLKKEAREGKLGGLSMAGIADKHVQKADETLNAETLLEKITNIIKSTINKGDTQMSDLTKEQVQEMIDTSIAAGIKKAVEALPKPLTKEEMATVLKAAVPELKVIKDIGAKIEKIEKASPGSNQDDGDPNNPDEIKKCEELGAAIAKQANGEG